MTGTEAILVVLVIVLIFMVVKGKQGMGAQRPPLVALNSAPKNTSLPVVSTPVNSFRSHPPGCGCASCKSYDKMAGNALAEQLEYFASCKDTDETSKALDCVCGDNEKFSFAENDYGAPGMDYKAYVTSQAVDDKVIKNHLAYVEERKGLGPEGEFTGRTYSPDSHDSYDPIPWVGLRRPQYVSQCNPTQVPDLDSNLYKGNRPFCFWT